MKGRALTQKLRDPANPPLPVLLNLRHKRTKLWLSPSAKQLRNTCFRPPSVYKDLSMHHGWSVCRLPIRVRGKTKRISGNSLGPLGD